VRQDAAFEEGVELVLDERGSSIPVLASVWVAMKLAACCCARQRSVICSGQRHWWWAEAPSGSR
jgi:hypothetical protein